MPRNMRELRVDDVRQFNSAKEVFNQLLAERSLHKAVCRDLTRVTRTVP